jgi:hypothetical protein
VVGRSSAFQFERRNEDVREVGRKLGVANVLEGSVRRDGNHVRITAELIKADDGFQLWSQTYDREIKDIFGVEDEIAQAATEALRLKLLGATASRLLRTCAARIRRRIRLTCRRNTFLGGDRARKTSTSRLPIPTRRSIWMRDMHQPGLCGRWCKTRWRRWA